MSQFEGVPVSCMINSNGRGKVSCGRFNLVSVGPWVIKHNRNHRASVPIEYFCRIEGENNSASSMRPTQEEMSFIQRAVMANQHLFGCKEMARICEWDLTEAERLNKRFWENIGNHRSAYLPNPYVVVDGEVMVRFNGKIYKSVGVPQERGFMQSVPKQPEKDTKNFPPNGWIEYKD